MTKRQKTVKSEDVFERVFHFGFENLRITVRRIKLAPGRCRNPQAGRLRYEDVSYLRVLG